MKTNKITIFGIINILFFMNCSHINTKKNEFYFFSRGTFLDPKLKNESADQFRRNWYSNQLKSMKEPSLLKLANNVECSVRFLWLRTFHHPISIRIEKVNENVLLYGIELSGSGGYKPGNIINYIKKRIVIHEYKRLLNLLIETDFWNMKTVVSSINEDGSFTINSDGAHWILECNSNNDYHIVDRWSPESGVYRDLCLFLLELAGFVIKLDEIY